MNAYRTVRITEGTYTGRTARVLEEGTFTAFGREITGLKVDAGLAGPLVLAHGQYEDVDIPEKKMPERFKRRGLRNE